MHNKVVLIQRIFPSYRKTIYDRLFEKFDFNFIHSKNKSGINSSFTDYSITVKSINYGKTDTQIFLLCFKELIKLKPDVIIHEFAIGITSLPIVTFLSVLFRRKLILYSHGYNRRKGFNPLKSFQDIYRLLFLKIANAVIVYGNADKVHLSNYINLNKIFVAKNTLDTKYLLHLRHEFQKEGRDKVKKRLGFEKKFNVIYIGRLLPEKLPELLIEMLGHLPLTQAQNIEIHFVGDGKERSNLECLVKNLSLEQSVRFHGAIYDDILTGAYLFASDLMILPGEIGLSVNHAFCFDCPVMTFKRKSGGPFHGPEEEYIINGVTGFQLEEHSVLAIARQVTSYLENSEFQDLIRSNISTYVQTDLSVDNMVRGFEDAINYVIAK